jgi:hypothetical protein
MHCPEFESRLHAVLDNRGDPAADPALTAHAVLCEPCGDLLADQLAILATIERLKRAGLVHQRPKQRTRNHVSTSLRLAIAVAASMLLALGLVRQIRDRQSRIGDVTNNGSRSMNLSAGTLAIAAHGRASANHPRLNGGDWLLEAPRLPHHFRTYRGTLGQLALTLPSALHRLDEVDHYAPGFNNLRASFDLIWHTIVPSFPSSGKTNPSASDPERTTRSADGPPLLA